MKLTISSFKFVLIAIVFAVFANTSRANEYIPFTNGVVFAKIIGPNKWTKETGVESKFDSTKLNYFYTTIEIVSTMDNFLPEIKGRKLKVVAGEFDESLLNKTVALHLINGKDDRTGRTELGFMCSDLRLAMMEADGLLKKQK